jgi:hypothetical protein
MVCIMGNMDMEMLRLLGVSWLGMGLGFIILGVYVGDRYLW